MPYTVTGRYSGQKAGRWWKSPPGNRLYQPDALSPSTRVRPLRPSGSGRGSHRHLPGLEKDGQRNAGSLQRHRRDDAAFDPCTSKKPGVGRNRREN